MKILVTGGLGFMGSAFIRLLLKTDKKTRIVNLDKVTYAANFENLENITKDKRYKFIKGDIADKKVVRKTAKGCQAIINYAAETHVDRSILDPDAFIKTDVLGTYNLLETARDLKIQKFIQISTDEVYGDIPKGYSKEADTIRPSSPYSASKASGDMLVLAYHRTYEVPTILTRASNNYGPYQYPEKIIPLFITNLLEGKKVPVYGKGNQVRDWLYVEDHARAIRTLLRRGKPGEIYNIGSDRKRDISNLKLTKEILRLTGKDKKSKKHIKDRPGHDLRYALNCDKLKRLGWRPQMKFDEGLAATVAWYKDNVSWWQRIKTGEYLKYYKKQYHNR
ncbi:dTDP-glucose 4,6-dehydratase [Patescibacteria group bacterium]